MSQLGAQRVQADLAAHAFEEARQVIDRHAGQLAVQQLAQRQHAATAFAHRHDDFVGAVIARQLHDTAAFRHDQGGRHIDRLVGTDRHETDDGVGGTGRGRYAGPDGGRFRAGTHDQDAPGEHAAAVSLQEGRRTQQQDAAEAHAQRNVERRHGHAALRHEAEHQIGDRQAEQEGEQHATDQFGQVARLFPLVQAQRAHQQGHQQGEHRRRQQRRQKRFHASGSTDPGRAEAGNQQHDRLCDESHERNGRNVVTEQSDHNRPLFRLPGTGMQVPGRRLDSLAARGRRSVEGERYEQSCQFGVNLVTGWSAPRGR